MPDIHSAHAPRPFRAGISGTGLMNGNFRNFAIWLVILFMLMGLFQVFQSSTRSTSVTNWL